MPVPSYSYDVGSLPYIPDFGATATGTLGKALPIGRDLELDRLTHDLKKSGGDLLIVKDGPAIRQEVDIRLKFLLGEWFLDVSVGVPYFQNVLVKAPNLSAIRTVLADEILATAGIKTLLSLDLNYDRAARRLKVTWSADTDLGELVASEIELEG